MNTDNQLPNKAEEILGKHFKNHSWMVAGDKWNRDKFINLSPFNDGVKPIALAAMEEYRQLPNRGNSRDEQIERVKQFLREQIFTYSEVVNFGIDNKPRRAVRDFQKELLAYIEQLPTQSTPDLDSRGYDEKYGRNSFQYLIDEASSSNSDESSLVSLSCTFSNCIEQFWNTKNPVPFSYEWWELVRDDFYTDCVERMKTHDSFSVGVSECFNWFKKEIMASAFLPDEPNSEQGVQVSDTTGDAQSDAADKQNKNIHHER